MRYPARLLLIIVGLTVFSSNSFANNSNFEQQLADIQKIADKSTALSQLEPLLLSAELTAKQKFSVYLATIFSYHELNDLDKALESSQKALEFAVATKMHKETATAHKMVGAMHYYRGENNSALRAYEQALKIFTSLKLPVSQANLHNNMALVHTTTGDIGKALAAYQEAEPLYQEYGNEEDKIDIRYNIAGLHIRLKRYEIAIEMLHEVIKKRLQMSDDQDLAGAYADIGVAYKHARQYPNAERYMNKAMDYYLGQKNFYLVTSQYQNLADLYNLSGEYDKAYQYALKTLELSEKVGHKKAFIGGLYTHATSLFQQGKLDAAIDELTLSSQKGREINYQPQVIENNGLMALVYAGKQDFTKALEFFRDYQYEQHRQASFNFDQQLAQFEVKQLTHQVKELEQIKKLQLLEQKQQRQAWKNTASITVAITLFIFLMYRRHAYKRLKDEMEIKVKRRTNELEVANKKLTDLSFLDGVTSIYNRRSFDVDMMGAWQRHNKSGNAFLLLIASVDEIRLFNSSYGHLAGDDLLKKVANVLKTSFREQDKVYRFAGSEFALILEDCDMDQASQMFEASLAGIAKQAIVHEASDHGVVTLSAGISQSNDNIQSIEQLIDRVDQRLYIAKKTGRNQLVSHVSKSS